MSFLKQIVILLLQLNKNFRTGCVFMYKINFNKPAHLHFIGIGGISMSGLAQVLLDRGFTISGSDRASSPLTEHLSSLGAIIKIGQCAENITNDIDAVVYTAAIHKDNPEFRAAVEMNIPMLTRAELLGQLMTNYETSVAVSGTHGKTTTTSMLTEILLKENTDPTISVGGILHSIGGNIRVGKGPSFVTEACEYTNSFLSLFPTIGIILNIEEDHLDFFKDINDIRKSFTEFAHKIPQNGLLVINNDIDNVTEITKGLKCPVSTYSSTGNADFTATDITYDELGHPSYDLVENGEKTLHIKLSVTGIHNVSNSLAVIAVCRHMGISDTSIANGLSSFTGTDRRFEYKGKIGNVTIIDDYAHHPTEIKATLTAAKNYPHNKIWCAFQPHTYTRTKAFFSDFAKALSLADNVLLLDIYAARETDTLGVSSELLSEEIKKYNPNSHYFESFDEAETFLLRECNDGDLIITMGAGDIYKLGEKLLGK